MFETGPARRKEYFKEAGQGPAIARDGEHRAIAISVQSVSKRFNRTLALDDVSLDVPVGSVLALLGPNGAGKSTLIDILCTIQVPTSGRVEIMGMDAVLHPVKVRSAMGLVFQEPTLDTRLTVAENLRFHGMVYQMGRADERLRMQQMLDLFELQDRRNAIVRTLSSGMRRRVEIARALMHRPSVLFLDEPTVGLDAQSRSKLWSFVEQLRQTRTLTIVLTTHYIEEVHDVDTVCIMDKGRILASGSPNALRAEHGSLLLKVIPRSAKARAALLQRFPEIVDNAHGPLLIRAGSPTELDRLVDELGTETHHVEVERQSLESVFLQLTGRSIDGASAVRRGAGRQ